MASVRSPGGALIVALAARELVRGGAARADGPEVVRSRSLRVDDGVAFRGPPGLRVKAARGDLPHVRPVPVHHEDSRLSRAVRDVRDLLARLSPRGLRVDPRVSREALEDPGRHREHVDFRVSVLRERQREEATVGAPTRGRVDPHERGESLYGPLPLEGKETEEVRVAVHERGDSYRPRVMDPDGREVD